MTFDTATPLLQSDRWKPRPGGQRCPCQEDTAEKGHRSTAKGKTHATGTKRSRSWLHHPTRLCGSGQVASPLWALVPPSDKWTDDHTDDNGSRSGRLVGCQDPRPGPDMQQLVDPTRKPQEAGPGVTHTLQDRKLRHGVGAREVPGPQPQNKHVAVQTRAQAARGILLSATSPGGAEGLDPGVTHGEQQPHRARWGRPGTACEVRPRLRTRRTRQAGTQLCPAHPAGSPPAQGRCCPWWPPGALHSAARTQREPTRGGCGRVPPGALVQVCFLHHDQARQLGPAAKGADAPLPALCLPLGFRGLWVMGGHESVVRPRLPPSLASLPLVPC